MAANSNRALSYALLDLAHADPKVRARTLYQVNSQFGSVSAEEKQAALTSIATKLSYEKNLDVKHALLELSTSWFPPASEPRRASSSVAETRTSRKEDDMVELEIVDDEYEDYEPPKPAPATERASSLINSQSSHSRSTDNDTDGPNTQEFSQKAPSRQPSAQLISRAPSGSVALPSSNSSINRSSLPNPSPTPPPTGVENETPLSRRSSTIAPQALPPLSRVPSATSSATSTTLNQPSRRLLPASVQSSSQSTQASAAPSQPLSPSKNAFGLMMGMKKRQGTAEAEGAPTAKRAKKAASTMQSNYRPPAAERQSFLDGRHAFGSSAPVGSAPQTNTSAMAFSGYSETGMPATYSAAPPSRTLPASLLQPHSTSKDMVPQRSIGVMATSPFANARPTPSTTFLGASATSSAVKLPPSSISQNSRAPSNLNNNSKPRLPYGALDKPDKKTPFNGSKSYVSRSSINTVGMPHPIDTSRIIFDKALSPNQRAIVEKALKGESFFFTGAAGTGKSFVLKEIIRLMKDEYKPEELQIMAPTGMAAIELGGWTINAFAGIGLGEGTPEDLLKKVKENPKSRNRWRQAAVLVIDEVSMLSAGLLEKLEYIADALRTKAHGPFGGLQLIMCGDFYQLPPVVKLTGNNTPAPIATTTFGFPTAAPPAPKKYAFESPSWNNCIKHTYTLTEIFRQVGDATFINILNEIRVGRPKEPTLRALRSCIRAKETPRPGFPMSRTAVASVAVSHTSTGAWETKSLAPEKVIEPTRLFAKKYAVQHYNDGRLKSIPGESRPFFATDSKSAGGDAMLKSLQEHCPAPATLLLKENAQVILLRNKATQGLVNGSRGTVTGFAETPDGKVLPLVRFETSPEPVIVDPETWTMEVGGVIMASREQIPLALAWAISIHKAQGMTISQVEVALQDVFEDGQAYVALSRVTSLAGLVITADFDERVIKANPSVENFYNKLQRL